jgi:hypothetical protein
MHQINNLRELQLEINALEERRRIELIVLKEQIQVTGEQMKPKNIIKNSLKDIARNNDIGKLLLYASLSISASFVLKKVISSNLMRPLNRLAGNALLMSAVDKVIQNPEVIQSIFNKFFGKSEQVDEPESETSSIVEL